MVIKVLGAGVAGLSAAYHLEKLGIPFTVYEKQQIIGGLCQTVRFEGFSFDTALHVLHFKDPEIRDFVLDLLGDDLLQLKRKSHVFYDGETIPYPFQVFFTLLSNKEAVKECIDGVKAIEPTKNLNSNFSELCHQSFGAGITKHFMKPYNEKIFQTPLNELSCKWTERFVPKMTMNDILTINKGEAEKASENFGYNVSFYYPRKGIAALPKAIRSKINKNKVLLKKEVTKISLSEKEIEFADNTKENWDILVSSIPLPELLSAIDDLPNDIRALSKKLRWVSVYNLNLGINGPAIKDTHWIYFPENQYSFYRLGYPSNLSPCMAPKGAHSISIEASFRCGFKPNFSEWKNQIINELLKTKLIKTKDDICLVKDAVFPFAYVIPDLEYEKVRDIILPFLSNHSIQSIGRYGLWEYTSIQDAIAEGKNVASSINQTQNR